ncbi:MAG: VCBS repeat-containing protein, partial [Planctomycetota bacterium]|nr:VCBS repeat-containing protein [Planctomycetota bacterium]
LLSIGVAACERPASPDPSPEPESEATASASDPAMVVAPAAESESWFVDETTARGIDFVHDSGARGRYRLPESFGAGCALFDADGDGDLDAYLVSGHDLDADPDPATARNRFFRNDGAGRFRENTATSGLGDVGYGYGVAVGDVDQDGDLDLYLANLGPDRLFLNEGDGTFVPAADERFANEDSFSVAPCFLDYDRDGDLDLFIARYMDWSPDVEVECRNAQGGLDYCSPEVYGRGISDRLLRNDGRGRFTDVSDLAGVSGDRGNGLAVGSADLDGDGWPDIFVANDKTPDQLWINQHDGTFREEAVIRGCSAGLDGSPRAGMSVAFADLDRDGDLEIHVSNIQGEPDSLFQNNHGRFFDRAAGWGIAAPSRARTRWSAVFRDFDVDGRPELLVGCGRVMRPATLELSEDAYAEEDLFYTFGENGRFSTVDDAWPSGLVPEATHGIATGDVDGDGFDDLLTVSRNGPARLLIRRPPPETPAPIRFDLRTPAGTPAIGATLRILREDSTSRPEIHPIQTTVGYASTSSHVVPVRPPVASVQIDWADGTSSTHLGPFEAGRPVILDPAAN